jgi:hypothetical protein
MSIAPEALLKPAPSDVHTKRNFAIRHAGADACSAPTNGFAM